MSDTEARNLRVHPTNPDIVSNTQDGGTPRLPELFSYYVIQGMTPYRFDDETIMEGLRRALQNGIQPVTVLRVIEDANFPPLPEPPSAAQQVIDFNGETISAMN